MKTMQLLTAQKLRKGTAQTPRWLTGHCKKASMHLSIRKYPIMAGAYSLCSDAPKMHFCAFYHYKMFFYRVHYEVFLNTQYCLRSVFGDIKKTF